MPPRHTAPCRQALRRPRAPARKHACISKSLLASVLERHSATSEQARRGVGQVPGPLESRRRLGKREMGHGHAVPVAAPVLPWLSAPPPDLSKWTWQAPSRASPRAREHAQERPDRAAWMGRGLPAWLSAHRGAATEDADADAGEARLPVQKALTAAEAQGPLADAVPVPEDQSLAAQVDDFCAALATALARQSETSFRRLRHVLAQHIGLGQVDGAQLVSIMDTLFTAVDGFHYEQSRKLSAHLCSCVIVATSESKVFSFDAVEASFWDAIMVRASAHLGEERLCHDVETMLAKLPRSYLAQVTGGLHSLVDATLSQWILKAMSLDDVPELVKAATAFALEMERCLAAARPGIEEPVNLDRARRCLAQARETYGLAVRAVETTTPKMAADFGHTLLLARMLECVGSEDNKELVRWTQERIEERSAGSAETRQYMLRSWLEVLSRLPFVNQDMLFDQAAASCGEAQEGGLLLTNVDVCSLMLQQWISRKYVQYPERLREYLACRGGSEQDTALAALCCALVHVDEPTFRGNLASLLRFLTKLGRVDELLLAFRVYTAAGMTTLRKTTEALAIVSRDYRVALRLHQIYKTKLVTRGGNPWWPFTMVRYLDAILAHDPVRVWQALGITVFEELRRRRWRRGRWRPPRPHNAERQRALAVLVARAAPAFAHAHAAGRISGRVAFRHLEQCVRWLERQLQLGGGRRRGERLPRGVLAALGQVVTRDLRGGGMGRGARLRWFLRVVQRNCGVEVALRTGQALSRWRDEVGLAKTLAKTLGWQDAWWEEEGGGEAEAGRGDDSPTAGSGNDVEA